MLHSSHKDFGVLIFFTTTKTHGALLVRMALQPDWWFRVHVRTGSELLAFCLSQVSAQKNCPGQCQTNSDTVSESWSPYIVKVRKARGSLDYNPFAAVRCLRVLTKTAERLLASLGFSSDHLSQMWATGEGEQFSRRRKDFLLRK